MDEAFLRAEVIATARKMNPLGINQGTSGNVSARLGGRMLITPTATAYEDIAPEQLAATPLTGEPAWQGPLPPSSEWRLHHAIYQNFAAAQAVVHTHAIFATTLSMARKEIPPCHYMAGIFGGAPIRCATYATFGTQEFANTAIAALKDRGACLLANHGMVVWGESLPHALWRAVELETLAKQYYHSLLIGGPVLLTDGEMAATAARLHGYGIRAKD
jgi:L-fuculose-phosphate aldolase